jgi:hypothetical protein
MNGVALVEVTYPDRAPYKHQHLWTSEGWLQAPVELADWKRETEEEQGCTLKILEWTLYERTDIGI